MGNLIGRGRIEMLLTDGEENKEKRKFASLA